ncbi:MAG: FAD-dependent oxidoreductase [Flavobacteriales bacterium]|nr:FAD-dependent oxidoreductase [Flavobacteriales bacterium]
MTKPIILCVDDDPEVLASVERDLRSQYRKEFRIVKALGSDNGLEAAETIKKRGTPIALFLVDQRMPGMTGTDFLAKMTILHPDSAKVLLTAYSDTEAAIVSINSIGLDHYLLKPWDPPEQKLYPVLDDLLSLWRSRAEIPFEGIQLAGAQWSSNCYEIKEFMSRNQIPYKWVDIDQDEAMLELVKSLTKDTTKLPIVFFPDGTHIIQPTHKEIADKVGLKTTADNPFYDVVVIGSGPAGLANAVYATSEGLKTLIVERSAPGGQAGTSSRIENYLGFPAGLSGADLAQRAVAQAKKFGAELLTAQEVVTIEENAPYKIVKFKDGRQVSAYTVVLATGMKVRKLEVKGIDKLHGVGVYYGAAMTEASTYKGQDVCIIGGANSAGQGALFFSRYAKSITMMIRRNSFAETMSSYLIERIEATPNITVLPNSETVEVEGETSLRKIIYKNIKTGELSELDSAAMFIFIGSFPQSDFVADLVARDDKGFILTGSDLPRLSNNRPANWNLKREPFLFETSVPGIFSVGDIRHGSNHRVAAAVGEGSACIHLVHKYIEAI